MKKSFTHHLKKTIGLLSIGFVLLFLFRLLYGYATTPNGSMNNSQSQFFESIRSESTRNYASKSYKVKTMNQSPTSVDQKYEKIAEVNAISNKFEEEEKNTRLHIGRNDAIIQFEQKSGNKGARRMHLQIGVPPENFDTLYNQLTKIGKVQSKRITKNDKTNEYKALTAKKASLEKIRNSLIELKSKGGKIEEYINLENRILETEQELQNLGVNLGDFDEENEFCTVKFSLNEGKVRKISLLHRVKVALEWTVPIYLGMMATLFFATLFGYVLLLLVEKLRVLERIVRREE